MQDAFAEAVALEEMGEITRAVRLYESILESEDDARAALNLGTIYYSRGLFGRASEMYRRATKIDPECAMAFYNLGNALDELGGYENAIIAYKRALRPDPRYSDVHYNLALAYEHQGEPRKAIRHWQAYIKLDPMGFWADHARRMIRKTISSDCLAIVWRRAEVKCARAPTTRTD